MAVAAFKAAAAVATTAAVIAAAELVRLLFLPPLLLLLLPLLQIGVTQLLLLAPHPMLHTLRPFLSAQEAATRTAAAVAAMTPLAAILQCLLLALHPMLHTLQ